MQKKILFVASTYKHFAAFHEPYFFLLNKLGYEVHGAANDIEVEVNHLDKKFDIPISRSPLSVNNWIAVKQLKEIIGVEEYELVHCHTAMGAVVARYRWY